MVTLIDTVVGAVPLVGDAFDVAFRANMKNLRLLQRHLDKQGYPTAAPGLGGEGPSHPDRVPARRLTSLAAHETALRGCAAPVTAAKRTTPSDLVEEQNDRVTYHRPPFAGSWLRLPCVRGLVAAKAEVRTSLGKPASNCSILGGDTRDAAAAAEQERH